MATCKLRPTESNWKQYVQLLGNALKAREHALILLFYQPGRNSGIMAGAGQVILELKVTLEVEAIQAEQQDGRDLGSEHCAVHT